MKRLIAFVLLSLCVTRGTAAAPPNVLLILADDLGYSDVGCYGAELSTPNLDALAKDGLRFTQFYNTARCWPTRASLLTGYYAQQVRRDALPDWPRGVPVGGRGVRPAWAKLLPERLRAFGYRSYHSGKWHVDSKPVAAGFNRSYWLDDFDRNFNPRQHFEDDKRLPPVAPGGGGYYSSTAIADHAIKCLKDHAANHAGKPFFEYVAFVAPHFPLQAPTEDVARYADAYGNGWDAVRQARFERMTAAGVFAGKLAPFEREVGPPFNFPEALQKLGAGEVNRPVEWASLDDAQRRFQAQKMAIHAAMITRMDREIGRVLGQVKAMGAERDTLVMFLSDNGASAEMMIRGDGHDHSSAPGSAGTFLSLGPGWSTAANTPFRRHKVWVHEGGIATPFIVRWPNGIPARGELRHNPGHAVDVPATILALAGAKPEDGFAGAPAPPPGLNLAPAFARDGAVAHEYLWWLHDKNRALRVGDWKIVAAGKDAPWELYDMAADRAETNDLAAAKPKKVKELAARWEAAAAEFRGHALHDIPGHR